jgi:glutamate 5-kinase
LLPSGIVSVKGEFGRGAAVLIVGPEGAGLARGLTAYSAAELRLIAGRKRAEFAGLIGGVVCDEAVHRDDMVLLI